MAIELISADTSTPFGGTAPSMHRDEPEARAGSGMSHSQTAVRPRPWSPPLNSLDYGGFGKKPPRVQETALGDFALACYLKGLGISLPDDHFEFLDDGAGVSSDEPQAVRWSGATTSSGRPAAPAPTAVDRLTPGATLRHSDAVAPFGTHYHEIEIAPGVTNLDVVFAACGVFTDPLVQIALIEQGRVLDILRCASGTWRKRLTVRQGATTLDRILVTVTATTTGGHYQLHVKSARPTPDVVVTRCNHPDDTRLGARSTQRHRAVPDIWVDNGGDSAVDQKVYLNQDNRMIIRLGNTGNALARHVFVEFWFQDASVEITPSGWLPVRNQRGVIQHLAGLSIEAGATQTSQVAWCPNPSNGSRHFVVRAVVRSLGDHNTDDKRVIASFDRVEVRTLG